MVKYKNQRELDELNEVEDIEREEEIMAVEPKTVQDATFKKRYDDARRGFQKYKEEQESRISVLERKLEEAHKAQLKLPKNEEEISEWQRNYPEFAGILEAIVQKRISDGLRESKTKLERIEERQKELEVQEAVLALKKQHPDFDQLVNDEAFHEWLGRQSKKYQDSIYNDLDVDAAAFVLDRYKAQKSKKSEKVDDRSSREDAAKVVRTSSVSSNIASDFGDYDFTESQIERESRKNSRWFDENEDKIMKAHRTGRIYMDISGTAQ
jgi:hypothetical protein